MATYAIGDIQGCFATLQRLLRRIDFDSARDRLWLVGDLVNRGPQSLEVLRWARALGDRVVAVLGNHDLHLLGRADGVRPAKERDTLDAVLSAPDIDVLMDWLVQRPLVHREGQFLLVHAGLLPQWTVGDAERIAREGEQALRSNPHRFLEKLPTEVSALTRIRTCTADGQMDERFSGPPEEAAPGYVPWFQISGRQSAGTCVVFGHWAALDLSLGADWMGLDSGCVWGRTLTAVRLSDRVVFQEPTAPGDAP